MALHSPGSWRSRPLAWCMSAGTARAVGSQAQTEAGSSSSLRSPGVAIGAARGGPPREVWNVYSAHARVHGPRESSAAAFLLVRAVRYYGSLQLSPTRGPRWPFRRLLACCLQGGLASALYSSKSVGARQVRRAGSDAGQGTDQILATRQVQLAAEMPIRLMPQRRRNPQIV